MPFAKRVLLAVVIHSNKEPGDSDRFKRRQVLGRFTAIPSLTKPQIEFLTFIASYYRSSLGSVLSMVIPAWLRSSKNLLASCEPETATAKSPLQKLLQKYAADLLRQPKETARALIRLISTPTLLTAEQQQALK